MSMTASPPIINIRLRAVLSFVRSLLLGMQDLRLIGLPGGGVLTRIARCNYTSIGVHTGVLQFRAGSGTDPSCPVFSLCSVLNRVWHANRPMLMVGGSYTLFLYQNWPPSQGLVRQTHAAGRQAVCTRAAAGLRCLRPEKASKMNVSYDDKNRASPSKSAAKLYSRLRKNGPKHGRPRGVVDFEVPVADSRKQRPHWGFVSYDVYSLE